MRTKKKTPMRNLNIPDRHSRDHSFHANSGSVKLYLIMRNHVPMFIRLEDLTNSGVINRDPFIIGLVASFT